MRGGSLLNQSVDVKKGESAFVGGDPSVGDPHW